MAIIHFHLKNWIWFHILRSNQKGCDNIKKKKLLFIICFLIVFNIIFVSQVFAADPKIVSKLNSAFESIQKWLLKLATPAAAVAVGTGIFMKKFSFGDEERIRLGKKLIKNSLFSYGFILALDLILAAIESLMG